MAESEGAPTPLASETLIMEQQNLPLEVSETLITSNEGGESSSGPVIEEEEGEEEGTLEDAVKLMEEGSMAIKSGDFADAAELFSRAVEIRVAHYGELASECSNAYYKYGCALLYKAQDETDPLGAMPKKESGSTKDSEQGSMTKGECSAASGVTDAKEDGNSNHNEEERNEVATDKGQVEDEDAGSEDEDLAEADEDDSDLDLAWKMLDVARVIVEKNPDDTMEKVDILSTLGEVALEREDIQASLSDYLNALPILERLVEPDSRQIAELPEEAIPYCQKAISVCKARIQRLTNEMKSSVGSASTTITSQNVDQSADGYQADASEIETLTGLSGDLEKKLEDLQQFVLQPKSIISEALLKMVSAAKTGQNSVSSTALSSSRMGTNESSGDFDSPTVSTAHTNGNAAVVTHLGVVGRGVKRMVMESSSVDSSSSKKPSCSSMDKGEGSSF
ncbi:hypothetical protein GIB67_005406 [Kingdonia uniflora]|uniref:Uncharacterized protein n=1 Tax=Kingdonia uniflora TaxID=39325 RepID=A0A7J7NHQ3_9MAGN|nr:hypothetical protein GIB67_005406 [Kingdonia uniflora]